MSEFAPTLMATTAPFVYGLPLPPVMVTPGTGAAPIAADAATQRANSPKSIPAIAATTFAAMESTEPGHRALLRDVGGHDGERIREDLRLPEVGLILADVEHARWVWLQTGSSSEVSPIWVFGSE